tara:strand:- start:661 stop:1371 length:711 start_codon:yes stop_codon:yes gene_type:complete
MFMENNLDNMILASGMTKTRVAEEKGITAQNLSRVIHGKTRLNIQDAEEYAKILGCSTQQVMFKADPIPIVAYLHYDADGLVEYDLISDRKDNPSAKIAKRNAEHCEGQVYLPGLHAFPVGAVIFSFHPDYSGMWSTWRNAITIVTLDPITEKRVSECSIQQASYVKIKDGPMGFGDVYPEPGGTYTVHNPWRQDLLSDGIEMQRNQKLEWATPAVTTYWQPKLRGIEIICDIDSK